MSSSPQPIVIAVAPNGARRGKQDHQQIPLTPAELASEAQACREAGAAMIHLHVRDNDGRHLLDAAAYQLAIDAIEAQVGSELFIQVTTEAAGRYQIAEQMQVVRDLKPAAISIALRELIPSPDGEPDAQRFLAWCDNESMHVQYILYSDSDLQRFNSLLQRGLIPGAHFAVLFVLGSYDGQKQTDPAELSPLVDDLSPDIPWMVCGFGTAELECARQAATLGGHARIGFENNLYLADGIAPNNAALVAATVAGVRSCSRVPTNAQMAKQILRSPR